ncbi:hypothetical protein [Litchfieldia salsa]|uniref:Uncharacterized protein n=1 Tax=Litchfieldia salsa TaxID=930152 RepID=A0A1H0PM47_9BACI|nr:hypothetical protein [Litchfieldia salsa]SDP05725.1 hypothetical protein SAMN05216565_101366 [Litchfieldia salsa]
MKIPARELYYLDVIQKLPHRTKTILGELIFRGSKDGFIVLKKRTREIQQLIELGLIVDNPIYRGKGFSISILPTAPHLHRAYKRKFQREGGVVIEKESS